MICTDVDMRKVCHSCRATVDHLEASAKLAPEGIIAAKEKRCEVARWEIVHQCLIGVAPLELCLPHLVVRIYKARAYDLVLAVYDLSIGGRNIFVNLYDSFALDEDVFPGGPHFSVGFMQ